MQNQVFTHLTFKKTPFELWNNKTPKIDYYRVFRSPCYIFNTKDNLDKFDSKLDKHLFLGYSQNSRTYRVLNKVSTRVEESIDVRFLETNPTLIDETIQ